MDPRNKSFKIFAVDNYGNEQPFLPIMYRGTSVLLPFFGHNHIHVHVHIHIHIPTTSIDTETDSEDSSEESTEVVNETDDPESVEEVEVDEVGGG